MDKNQFLNEMRSMLNGKVPANVIEENIRYYESYITTQIRQGKTENQVLNQLGDPRLIAKTIIEANKHAEGEENYQEENNSTYEKSGKVPLIFRFLQAPSWIQVLIVSAIIIFIMVVLGTVIRILFPVIILAFLIVFLLKLFGNNR